MNINKTKKILCFFGSDVKNHLKILQDANKNDYTLLALDSDAIGIVAKLEIPYTLIDDWVSYESLLDAIKKTELSKNSWFNAAKDEFTYNGICWPQFDFEAMRFFWSEVFLIETLADAFLKADIEELCFFEQVTYKKPKVFYYPSNIYIYLLKAELNGKVFIKSWEVGFSFKKFFLRSFILAKNIIKYVIKIIFFHFKYENKNIVSNCITRKIVFVLNPGEVYRFTPIIEELKNAFPEQVALIMLSHNQKLANRKSQELGIEVFCEPMFKKISNNLSKDFLFGYQKILKNIKNGKQFWVNSLKYLKFHFEYYCTQRWPELNSRFQAWVDFWSKHHNPQAIVVSSLMDAESQLPAEAAKRFNIPTFSIPHGAINSGNIASSSYHLYSLAIQKVIYEKLGVPKNNLFACNDIIMENEYLVSKVNLNLKKTWSILVLTNPTGISDGMPIYINCRAQINALKALESPPQHISKRLSMHIKVHPGYPDSGIFYAVNKNLRDKILPTDSKLLDILQEVDLVIALNYYGSALVHTLRTNKATIFFITDPLIKEGISSGINLYFPSGSLVHNYDELWYSVEQFFTNPEQAIQMKSKAEEFCQNFLDDSHYPSISEVISRVLKQT